MTLRIVRRDGNWLVLNRHALRSEAIGFFFRPGMSPPPTITELYPRTPVPPSGIDMGDTHWALAQNAFAARRDLYNQLTAEAARQMADTQDTRDYAGAHPDWIPNAVWRQFMSAAQGVHRYRGRSRLDTDIILIKRGTTSGYAEMPTDLQQVQRMLGVIPPSTLRRIFTGDTVANSRARWLVDANQGFNRFMWQAVNDRGMGAGEANQAYRNAVHQRFLRAYLPLIGGSFAAHPAGGTIGDGLREAGWI